MAWIPLLMTILTLVVAFFLRRSGWAPSALLASRLAYGALVLQAPLYFLSKGGFRAWPPGCEWKFGFALAVHSLTNYKHIVLFAVFFLLTCAQFRAARRRIAWSAAATLTMGLVVELAQGVSGQHHCRMRDLVPDSVGALAGIVIVWTVTSVWHYSQRRHRSSGQP